MARNRGAIGQQHLTRRLAGGRVVNRLAAFAAGGRFAVDQWAMVMVRSLFGGVEGIADGVDQRIDLRFAADERRRQFAGCRRRSA